MYSSGKEFYLTIVRHGQTIANALKIIQGHWNKPLTELGVEQARALARYLKTNDRDNFDRIYSSDLDRAYTTCEIITNVCLKSGKTITKDARLRERKYGPHYEGKPIDHLLRDAYALGFDEKNFTQYTPEGAESMDEVRQRVTEFCNDILWHDCQQGEEVLIVSHWATIKEFLKLFQPNSNGSIREEHLVETPNVAFSRFKIRCKLTVASPINGAVQQSEKLMPSIQVICLHQTPHLSLEQNTTNLRNQVE